MQYVFGWEINTKLWFHIGTSQTIRNTQGSWGFSQLSADRLVLTRFLSHFSGLVATADPLKLSVGSQGG